MVEDARVCAGGDCMGNGIIFGAAMAEKKQENGASEVFGCIPHGARAYFFVAKICRQ